MPRRDEGIAVGVTCRRRHVESRFKPLARRHTASVRGSTPDHCPAQASSRNNIPGARGASSPRPAVANALVGDGPFTGDCDATKGGADGAGADAGEGAATDAGEKVGTDAGEKVGADAGADAGAGADPIGAEGVQLPADPMPPVANETEGGNPEAPLVVFVVVVDRGLGEVVAEGCASVEVGRGGACPGSVAPAGVSLLGVTVAVADPSRARASSPPPPPTPECEVLAAAVDVGRCGEPPALALEAPRTGGFGGAPSALSMLSFFFVPLPRPPPNPKPALTPRAPDSPRLATLDRGGSTSDTAATPVPEAALAWEAVVSDGPRAAAGGAA